MAAHIRRDRPAIAVIRWLALVDVRGINKRGFRGVCGQKAILLQIEDPSGDRCLFDFKRGLPSVVYLNLEARLANLCTWNNGPMEFRVDSHFYFQTWGNTLLKADPCPSACRDQCSNLEEFAARVCPSVNPRFVAGNETYADWCRQVW